MKLFVWDTPYYVPYGNSVAVAVAETVDEARELVNRRWLDTHPSRRLDEDDYRGVGAEPTSVHDLPCAEFFEWSE